MKNTFINIKVILNLILWFAYSLIWIILSNFIFAWLVPTILKRPVALSSDPIHLKIAVVTVGIITIITVIFRKYLYLSIKEDIEKESFKEKFKMQNDDKNNENMKVDK